jgi:tetratricopeptide (TPR) repeat protein
MEAGVMKSMKASIRVAITALALGLSLSTPSRAGKDEATALDQKVTALYNAGKYAAAIPLARQSLAIREKTLAPDDEKVGLSLNNLAALEYNQGHYAEAEPLYKRSLAISEKLLGPVTRKWQDC